MTIQSRPAGPVQVGDPAGPLHLQPIHQPPQLHHILGHLIGGQLGEVLAAEPRQDRDRSSRSDSSIAAPTRAVTGQTILFAGDQSGRWPNLLRPYPIEHMFDCQVHSSNSERFFLCLPPEPAASQTWSNPEASSARLGTPADRARRPPPSSFVALLSRQKRSTSKVNGYG